MKALAHTVDHAWNTQKITSAYPAVSNSFSLGTYTYLRGICCTLKSPLPSHFGPFGGRLRAGNSM
jgi:hypothetical protein